MAIISSPTGPNVVSPTDRGRISDEIMIGGSTYRPEAEDWSFYGHRGKVLTTDHFRIFTTLGPSDTRTSLPAFIEGSLQIYRSTFGDLPPPRRMMDTFVFRDKRQWRIKTREILPEQAGDFMGLGRGGFTTQGTSVLYYIGMRDTRAIAAHEGWHQYTQTTFRDPLPVWLEEGLATYMEAMSPPTPDRGPILRPWDNDERRYALRRAIRRDRLIPLDELLERTPQSFLSTGKGRLLTYYAQVWALSRFLIEGEGGKYRSQLEALVLDACEGRLRRRMARSKGPTGMAILRTYFSNDAEVMAAEFERFSTRIAHQSGPLPAQLPR